MSGRSFSWLDVRLGLRMMLRYPGVSLVIVLALAVGIPVSLMPNHLFTAVVDASPPFDQGRRVVGIVGVGQDGRTEIRVGDYERLRDRLETFERVGAVMPIEVNVIAGTGVAQGERAAVMTASLFTLTRVPPIVGRVLQAADEVKGAPDVAVIGYRFWRRRLGGTANVVGTTLRIAGVPTTIVGVMPEGFAMPSTEQIWLPFRFRSVEYPDRLGPAVWMYGRLADGVSMAQARSELNIVPLQIVAGIRPNPVRADLVPFSAVQVRLPQGPVIEGLITFLQVVPVILLLIACGNAAILILARTATRAGEVAVRTVLGASRARIVGQLFVETLLLALVATGIGLVAMDVVVARVAPRFTLPFWFSARITPVFALKALALSILCAVVAGVLPALRATGRGLQVTMQSAGMGGGTLRLGRVAGALIIVEVALGTAAVFGGGLIWRAFQPVLQAHTQTADANRYLVASIRIPRSGINAPAPDSDDEQLRVRLATLQDELGRRLSSEAAVHAWTFSNAPPGRGQERDVRVESGASQADQPILAGVETFVDPSFFAVLHVSPVAGRLFGAADVSAGPAVEPATAIVNMKFLERRGMPPQTAIGSRLQLTVPEGGKFGSWKEIVGVVPNIEPAADREIADGTPMVYLPAALGSLNPMTVTLDLGNQAMAFAPTLRRIVTDADPAALLENVYPLDQLPTDAVGAFRLWMSVMTGIALLAILLSTTALYALMSMTVAQRKREFGIRLALGGSSGGVVLAVARRALVQIAAGVTLGAAFWVVMLSLVLAGGEIARTVTGWPYMLAAAAAAVIAIGLAASLGPTLKYVRMRPIETLRVDG